MYSALHKSGNLRLDGLPGNSMIKTVWPCLLGLLLVVGAPLQARDRNTTAMPVPAHGVIGVEDAQLQPGFWIARLQEADRVLLDPAAIAAQNARLLQLDDSMHDLRALPASLDRARVAGWIEGISQRPDAAMFDVEGRRIPETTLDGLVDALALDAIPQQQATRHGLVVRRADLRTFPTALRVFSRQGETDIDRFQESALFPGTPVAVVHESGDGEWLFVVSARYAAWIQKQFVAEGSKDEVFAYVDSTPYRILTGARENTVFTREQPQVSELQLDMGVRIPLADRPADTPVNGQHSYTAHVLELPIREDDGTLRLVPALLPRRADSAAGYLPLTRANLIGQAFKFLGERYGWGHGYNGRDCSGFVSEIYRSMGVQLPRNTSDQAVSPALEHTTFDKTTPGGKAREAAVAALQPGDLVYIPGHVMMVIGRIDGAPYVIHDTNGGTYLGADGQLKRMGLNGVSVTPLLPMMFNEKERYVDRMTSVVRPYVSR